MTRSRTLLAAASITIAATALAALGGRAISAQDKYTVQVPNGLAFAEFRGYEDWQTVAVSQTGDLIEVILANPVMIEAYRAGAPGNGKPFPDGSKMAKIHWNTKKSAEAPAPTTVPDTLHDVDFMVRDSKRFADTGNWGYAQFDYDTASDTFKPLGTAPSAATRATRSWRRRITCSPGTRSGERGTGARRDRGTTGVQR